MPPTVPAGRSQNLGVQQTSVTLAATTSSPARLPRGAPRALAPPMISHDRLHISVRATSLYPEESIPTRHICYLHIKHVRKYRIVYIYGYIYIALCICKRMSTMRGALLHAIGFFVLSGNGLLFSCLQELHSCHIELGCQNSKSLKGG